MTDAKDDDEIIWGEPYVATREEQIAAVMAAPDRDERQVALDLLEATQEESVQAVVWRVAAERMALRAEIERLKAELAALREVGMRVVTAAQRVPR